MKYLTGTSRTIFFYCIVFFLLTSLHFTFAQDKKSQNAKLEINKLTLFKNGLGFVVSTTELPGNAESIKIGQLPVPTFGTFWVSYPKEVKMHNLVTTMEKNEKEYPIQSLGRMLLLNTGRKVIIHTSDKDYEGIVLSKSYEDETPQTPNPYYMGYKKTNDPSVWGPAYDDKVISIKTEKGVVAVSSVNIYRVEFLDDNPVSTTKSIEKSPSIIMQLDKPAGGEKITVSYLAHGITWSPSYLIDLSDPKTAKFSAHAMIINEMTDLNNIKLQLTTGFPNIKFGNVLNPIAKSQSLAEFLNALGGSTSRYGSDRGIMSQQIMLSNSALRYDAEEAPVTPEYSTVSEGLSAEDLFFYPVDNFSIKKDETAWVPLFSTEMPYKHIYTWKINDFVDQNDYYRAVTGTGDVNKFAEEIWHSCRLTNSLNMPLTTAATEFVTNGEFTGQDICYYTPSKGETTIRINKALNVLADQAEIEIDRKRDAGNFHGYRYDLVKVRGELKIKNRTDKSINLEISKELSGEVLESSPKCMDVKTAKGLKQVNEKHQITWNLDLTPGKEESVIYQYQVYIRE